MCYHLQQALRKEKVVKEYPVAKIAEKVFEENAFYYANGFDHNHLIVYKNDGALDLLQWGLIPHFAKNLADARELQNRTLNAISEEAFEKASFKFSIQHTRCLIPVNGFFEWKHVGKSKIPHFIRLRDQELFSLGGVWNEWTDKATGEVHNTFAVLTTKANSLMEDIHNSKKRQPVIIPGAYYSDWLGDKLNREDVLALCAPVDSTVMEAFPVSKLITSRSEDKNVQAITTKASYPELNIQQGLF